MAVDASLLEDAERSHRKVLRLYRWDPPTVSIGRNQSPDGVVREGIPWVRRPTGGQAVWHAHEVTYAVAAPIALFGSLRSAYREIHERLARALRGLGIPATIAPPPAVRSTGRPAACFAVPVGGEILIRGRKVVGSAQVRRRTAFLQHGSILLSGSQAIVGTGAGDTTLTAALGRSVTFAEVAAAVVEHWGEPLRPSGRQAVRPLVIASAASR